MEIEEDGLVFGFMALEPQKKKISDENQYMNHLTEKKELKKNNIQPIYAK